MSDLTYAFSDAAARQFQSLLEGVGEQRGWQRSIQVEEQLYTVFARLAAFPGLGHTRVDLVPPPALFYYEAPYMAVLNN